jgi:hypothetical protein
MVAGEGPVETAGAAAAVGAPEPRNYQRHGINNQSMTVSIPGRLRDLVRLHAAHRGTTVSAVVAAALRAYLLGDEGERAA